MKSVERITSVKSELLDILMSMKVDEHAERQRSAAQRHLRARRGIELHREIQKLSKDIAPLLEDEEYPESDLH